MVCLWVVACGSWLAELLGPQRRLVSEFKLHLREDRVRLHWLALQRVRVSATHIYSQKIPPDGSATLDGKGTMHSAIAYRACETMYTPHASFLR